MTEIRWEQYPLVLQHELARSWLQRQAHLQLAPNTLDAYGRCLNDYLSFCARHSVQPEAVTVRHGDVGQHHIRKNLLTHGQGVLGPRGHRHQGPGVFEDRSEEVAGVGIVFDDENMDSNEQVTRNGRLATAP